MSIWWSLHLRRDAASVPLARRLLLGTMETAGVDPDISYDLSVALSEACANAVEHGGTRGHGASSQAYRVTAYLVRAARQRGREVPVAVLGDQDVVLDAHTDAAVLLRHRQVVGLEVQARLD